MFRLFATEDFKWDVIDHPVNRKECEILHEGRLKNRCEDHPKWPMNRSLQQIEALYETPGGGEIPSISIKSKIASLPENARVLDVGPGEGNFLKDVYTLNPKLKCYGVAIHLVKLQFEKCLRQVTYSEVPTSKRWLERHFNSFSLVMDTFSSLTYSKNPLHSLIYLTLALAPNSDLCSLSQLFGHADVSCFGDLKTRKKIQSFFKKHLGLDLRFDLYSISSMAALTNLQMRIHVHVPKTGLVLSEEHQKMTSWKLWKALQHLADMEIGLAKDDLENKYFGEGYSLCMKTYETVAQVPESTSSCSTATSFRR